MRKVHDIVPGRIRLKRAILLLRLDFWARGFIVCASDVDLQKEMLKWPDGFIFLFQILPDKPHIGFKKDANGLHIIKGIYHPSHETVIAFKSMAITQDIFKGRMAIRQAFSENRFELKGESEHYSSVLRAMIITHNSLFPRLVDHGCLRPGHKKRVSRLKILFKILLMGNKRKEALSYDTEVLRVFE